MYASNLSGGKKPMERIILRHLPLPHAHDIVLCIFSEPLLTINRLQKALKLSARQTASKYLSIIVDAGILEERKLGKHKIFFSKAFLRLLS